MNIEQAKARIAKEKAAKRKARENRPEWLKDINRSINEVRHNELVELQKEYRKTKRLPSMESFEEKEHKKSLKK